VTSSDRTVAGCLEQAVVPQAEAHLLLGHVLQLGRARLYAFPETPVSQLQFEQFLTLARRRQAGEPVAYLVGKKEFWSLPLKVSKQVLIPRPETELLVELALRRIHSESSGRVLDLGTGSGAIALAIASERPSATIVAVDASPEALSIATQNAEALGLTQIRFLQTNWYQGLEDMAPFNLIVANPPYISESDNHLADLGFEPANALVAAEQGLADLRAIVSGARSQLTADGYLLVEHGHSQQTAVQQMFAHHGFTDIQKHRDLADQPRAVSGCARSA